MKKRVAAEISTKGRYFSTLPLALNAIAMQTRPPDEIHIFDDNTGKDRLDLREYVVSQDVFALFHRKGIVWHVHFGKGIGQVANHQDVLTKTDADYIWRLDDDNLPEPNVLETLLKGFDIPNVGASSCKIWKPSHTTLQKPKFVKNKLSLGIDNLPAEWFDFQDMIIDAEHLYSTYLFDRRLALRVGGYPDFLSTVGHREETIFSHTLFREGFKLVISPDAITWHYHNPEGGVRSFSDSKLWEDDENKYLELISGDWGYELYPDLHIYLDGGIGDHYTFKLLLPELVTAHPDRKIILSVTYPMVFDDVLDKFDITIISNAEGAIAFGDVSKYNIYKFMHENKWTDSMLGAYRKIYIG